LAASRHEGIKKATAVGVQSGILYFVAYAANGLAFWQGSHQIADAVRDINNGGTTVGAVFTVIFILVEGRTSQRMLRELQLTIRQPPYC
jgi:ATP-binding cassette subfamily B (MDR/TAP) protein 1